MSWTNVRAAYLPTVNTTSTQIINHPTRLRALWMHCETSGTLTCYDASAATSTTGPITMQIALPHDAGATPGTQSLLLPSAGIRHEIGMFVVVSTTNQARLTFFYD
jgi:hypothetical protein